MRFALVVAVVAGCTQPPPPPSYYTDNPHRTGTQRVPTQQQVGLIGSVSAGDPNAGSGSAAPAIVGNPSPAQIACGQTIVCYTKCKPISEPCMEKCDASAQQGGASAGARQVVACMLDSGCKDEPCARKACTAEFEACLGIKLPPLAAAPAPAPAPAPGGTIDVTVPALAGWTQAQLIRGALTLEKDAPGIEYRIHVFPSQARVGGIMDLFKTTWTAMVSPGFETAGAHGPYRRRLASGYALAYDAAQLTIKGTARTTTVGLYLLYTNDRVVTILATGLDAGAEADAAKLFDALAIADHAASPEPLFDPVEVTGTWVDGADRLTLEPSGRFTTSRKTSGSWKLEDDTIALDTRGKRAKRRVCGRGPAPVGGGTALCIERDARPTFAQPSATWYAEQ